MLSKARSTRFPSLAIAAFAASLAAFAGSAHAAANCPAGSTCTCQTVIETDCTVGANGKLTCTRNPVLECTVVSGPGSGKAALAPPTGLPPTQPTSPIGALPVYRPKSFAFTR